MPLPRWLVLLAAAVTLTGCGATVREVYTPDGRRGATIDCSAYRHSWSTCYAKASDLCGARGYDIIVRAGEPGAQVFDLGASTIMGRSMVIACKGP